MKKILVCALVLVLCITAFVACNNTTNEGLESAKEYLQTMYKDAAVETGKDYTRPAIVKIGETTYDVEWSVEIKSGPNTVSVSEAVNSMVTINLDEFSAEEVVYTLTATIKDSKGKSVTLTFNHKVPAFALNTYEEYVAACDLAGDDIITIKGYVVGANADSGSSSKGSLWIVDANGHGYYAYKPTLDTAITASREAIEAEFPRGTEVVVKGKVTNYGGTYEYAAGCEIIKTGNSVDPSTLAYVDRTQLFTDATSIDDATTLVETQATRAAINGVTMGVVDGNNYYFSIGDVDFIFYMNIYLLTPEQQDELKAAWVVGGKANIKGVINVYSGKYQLYPDSLDSLEIVVEDLTDAEKVARQKDILTLDEVYNANFTLPAGTWANVAWAIEGEGATLDNDGLAVTIHQTTAEQTVTITAIITSGEATDTKVFTVKIAAQRSSFIKAALDAGAALEDKATTTDSYIVIGTVSSIKEAYSEQYKNITFYVVDAEGNELLVFRYNLDDASTIAVGDAVAFAAPIKKYGTDIEAVADFVALDVMSLADAAAAGLAGTGVDGTVVYGYVKSIDTEYSAQHNNITVTISDGTNDLNLYRLSGGETLAVGDYILVTGTPSAYNNKAQMAQGATYVTSPIYVATETPCEHVDEDPADCICDLCQAELEHVNEEGDDTLCDICDKDLSGGSTDGPELTHAGTEADPYSVTDALAIANTLPVSGVTAKVYITGTIKSIGSTGTYLKNVYIVDVNDATKEILVYSVNFSNEVTTAYVNDTVTIHGYIKNYNGTLEIADGLVGSTKDYPTFTARTAGTSAITSTGANATVTLGAESGLNGSQFTFTVEVASGYTLVSVKVNGTTVTDVDGTYTGTVEGPTVVAVETAQEGAPVASSLGKVTFGETTNSASIGSYTDTWSATENGITLNIANFNNNNNGWTYIKCGRKSDASVASISTGAMTQHITKVVVTVDSVLDASKVSVKLVVASDANFSTVVEEVAGTLATGEMSFNVTTPSAGLYYKVVFDCQSHGTKNGIVQISAVELFGYTA